MSTGVGFMQKKEIEDFIKFAKEQFGYDISVEPTEMPDSFEGIFEYSFINKSTIFDLTEYFEGDFKYTFDTNRRICSWI